MTSTLMGVVGCKIKIRCFRRRGWVSEYSGRPIFIFFIKENWICTMTRHYANNMLSVKNLPSDSDVRQ